MRHVLGLQITCLFLFSLSGPATSVYVAPSTNSKGQDVVECLPGQSKLWGWDAYVYFFKTIAAVPRHVASLDGTFGWAQRDEYCADQCKHKQAVAPMMYHGGHHIAGGVIEIGIENPVILAKSEILGSYNLPSLILIRDQVYRLLLFPHQKSFRWKIEE